MNVEVNVESSTEVVALNALYLDMHSKSERDASHSFSNAKNDKNKILTCKLETLCQLANNICTNKDRLQMVR